MRTGNYAFAISSWRMLKRLCFAFDAKASSTQKLSRLVKTSSLQNRVFKLCRSCFDFVRSQKLCTENVHLSFVTITEYTSTARKRHGSQPAVSSVASATPSGWAMKSRSRIVVVGLGTPPWPLHNRSECHSKHLGNSNCKGHRLQ